MMKEQLNHVDLRILQHLVENHLNEVERLHAGAGMTWTGKKAVMILTRLSEKLSDMIEEGENENATDRL